MMNELKSDWSEHVDELSRKTLEELDHWTRLNAVGRKSDGAFLIAVGVMWDVTAGLVRQEVSDLLASVHKELENEIRKKRRDR